MSRVGFVGLGNMGGKMATHLAHDGVDLVVYDIDESAIDPVVAAGARGAASVQELAERAEIIMLSLPGPPEVLDVVDRIEAELESGDVIVDMTTSTPSTTNALDERLAGISVLSAPVSGGPSGAKNATLSVMVGGDPAIYERCRPLFDVLSANVFYIGDQPGSGHAMKLINNYLSNAAIVCTSEAVVMGEQVGLDKETMVDVLNASTGRNTATVYKFPEYIIPETYDMDFSLDLVDKDMQLLMDVSRDSSTPLLAGSTIRQLIGYIRNELGGDADYTEIYKYFAQAMRNETIEQPDSQQLTRELKKEGVDG